MTFLCYILQILLIKKKFTIKKLQKEKINLKKFKH